MPEKELSPLPAAVHGDKLATQRIDYLVAAVKGVASAVPIVGGLFAELVTLVIPQQRIDRVTDLVERIVERLDATRADIDQLAERFRSPAFVDILEEAVLQAGRAHNHDRRQYLANLLVAGLDEAALDHARIKKLLFLLDELLDEEVIWLTYQAVVFESRGAAFFQIHQQVLPPITATDQAPDEIHERAALQKSYQQRLVQLGLVDRGNVVTPLGRLLLRYIDSPNRNAAG